MRRAILILLLPVLAGCAWFRDPPQTGVTTGATVVYNGGPGGELFSLCDRGNLVYLTKSQPAVAVIRDGCNPNAQDSTLAQVAALQRIADRPHPPPFTIPSPLPVLVVPDPNAPKVAAVEREPVILRVEPPIVNVEPPIVTVPACPTCPQAPTVTPLPSAPSRAAPKASQTPAHSSKVVVVPQVDPNTASAEDLERLPGVTAKMAQAIAKGRPYRTLQDLAGKKALSEADLRALAPYMVIR